MTIGIFGGSFNPPHMGHLIVTECVRDQLQLDKVLFVPSAQTPNKFDEVLASPACRLEMTRLAVEANSKFDVSDIEVQRRGVSYTVDTITAFQDLFPSAALTLIIGADNFREFPTWKDPDAILSKARLVVMSRPGFPVEAAKHEFARDAGFVNVPQIGISGTDIRRRLKLGRSIRYLVPQPVEEYIQHKRLYRG